MEFAPLSSIGFMFVDFDNTYKNIVRFKTENERDNYFTARRKFSCEEYLVVRKIRENGSLVCSVKVNIPIEKLYQCNYMRFQNNNHTGRRIYAFITSLVYVNEGTTEVFYETDVFQTWWFEVKMLDSFVEREHTNSDNLFEHLVPEPIKSDDYEYREIETSEMTHLKELIENYVYLIALTENPFKGGDTECIRGEQSGVFQGLYFFMSTSASYVEKLIASLDQEIVMSITKIPLLCVSKHMDDGKQYVIKDGFVSETSEPAELSIYENIAPHIKTIEQLYEVKNKKVFTYPYTFLSVTLGNKESEYAFEKFLDTNVSSSVYASFKLYGDVSISPSIIMCPENYEGRGLNIHKSVSMSNFPQCSFSTDAYKIWLAKNTGSQVVQGVDSLAKMAVGAGLIISGYGVPVGAGLVYSGAKGVAGIVTNDLAAQKLPNNGNVGEPSNNLLVAMKEYKFNFAIKHVRKELLKRIDDYFTLYGYKVDTLKVPNIFTRPKYTYVQTVDCNIVGKRYPTDPAYYDGGIPNDDMNKLKSIFNNGATFWDKDTDIGDYSVDNSPA